MDLKDLTSPDPKIKYSCSKRAIHISKINPGELYGQFDTFVDLLDNEKNVLKWTGIIVIGNLSMVDTEGKIDKVLSKFIGFVNDKILITAANAINALGMIAKYQPQYLETILPVLLGVENATYYLRGKISPECRNVCLGHVLNVLESLGPDIYYREEVKGFLQRQTDNTRPKVSAHAKKLLTAK